MIRFRHLNGETAGGTSHSLNNVDSVLACVQGQRAALAAEQQHLSAEAALLEAMSDHQSVRASGPCTRAAAPILAPESTNSFPSEKAQLLDRIAALERQNITLGEKLMRVEGEVERYEDELRTVVACGQAAARSRDDELQKLHTSMMSQLQRKQNTVESQAYIIAQLRSQMRSVTDTAAVAKPRELRQNAPVSEEGDCRRGQFQLDATDTHSMVTKLCSAFLRSLTVVRSAAEAAVWAAEGQVEELRRRWRSRVAQLQCHLDAVRHADAQVIEYLQHALSEEVSESNRAKIKLAEVRGALTEVETVLARTRSDVNSKEKLLRELQRELDGYHTNGQQAHSLKQKHDAEVRMLQLTISQLQESLHQTKSCHMMEVADRDKKVSHLTEQLRLLERERSTTESERNALAGKVRLHSEQHQSHRDALQHVRDTALNSVWQDVEQFTDAISVALTKLRERKAECSSVSMERSSDHPSSQGIFSSSPERAPFPVHLVR